MEKRLIEKLFAATELCAEQGFEPDSVFVDGDELHTPSFDAVEELIEDMEEASVTFAALGGPRGRKFIVITIGNDRAATVVPCAYTPDDLVDSIREAVA